MKTRKSSGRPGMKSFFKCVKCSVVISTSEIFKKQTRAKHQQATTAKKENAKSAVTTVIQGGGNPTASMSNKSVVTVTPRATMTKLRNSNGLNSETENGIVTKCFEEIPLKGRTSSRQQLQPGRRQTVAIKRSSFNEIIIIRPEPGKREVFYRTEAEEELFKKSKSKCDFREWHVSKLESLPLQNSSSNRESELKQLQSGTMMVLKMPSEYPWMFNVDGYTDDMHSMLDILSGDKMTGMVLDAHISLQVNNHKENCHGQGHGHVNFHCVSVETCPMFDGKDKDASSDIMFHPEAKYFRKFRVTNDNSIVFAPLYASNHFYLAVYDFRKMEVRIYDSSWLFVSNEQRLKQVLCLSGWLSAYHYKRNGGDDVEWTISWQEECTQQIDEFSCGAYVSNFVSNEISGKLMENTRNLSEENLAKIRLKIVTDLLATTSVGRHLLDAISE